MDEDGLSQIKESKQKFEELIERYARAIKEQNNLLRYIDRPIRSPGDGLAQSSSIAGLKRNQNKFIDIGKNAMEFNKYAVNRLEDRNLVFTAEQISINLDKIVSNLTLNFGSKYSDDKPKRDKRQEWYFELKSQLQTAVSLYNTLL